MKRHPEAEEQIAEARGPVETPEPEMGLGNPRTPVCTGIMLDGEQRDAYMALVAAAKRSAAAQVEVATAGGELRDALARFCKSVVE